MAYQIGQSEPVATAIKRVGTEQIERAIDALTAASDDPARAVHEARKRFKEMRALLRLVRGPLGDGFAVENRFFRDLGRSLSAARDADAMIEAFSGLQPSLDAPSASLVREALESRRSEVSPASIDAALDALSPARFRPGTWMLQGDDFDLIGDGLRRTYRDGRKARSVIDENPDAHNFHQWRKRVKDHWYHAQLLDPMLPPGYSDRLKELSRLLGDHHDLAVLTELLRNDPARFGGEATVAAVLVAADQNRQRLEADARTAGVPIYAGRPREWFDSLRSQWARWRAMPTPPAP